MHFTSTEEATMSAADDEINEDFEMQASPDENRLRNENVLMHGVVVKAQNAQEARIYTNISDLYLEPILVSESRMYQNEEEINSNHYLEVIKET